MSRQLVWFAVILTLASTGYASGSEATAASSLDVSHSMLAWFCVLVLVLAYALVVTEEVTHLRKSKPVMLAAGLIWLLVAIAGHSQGEMAVVKANLEHAMLEYGELFLFLLTAMTYINVLAERQVFTALKSWLTNLGLSYRNVFWLTGILSFFLSPVIDNLTTALVMCSVVLAIGRDKPGFVGVSCVNIVVAANAGGTFSPFGDITTLMVWQQGILSFNKFFALFVPALVNYLVPAVIMSFAITRDKPDQGGETIHMKRGAVTVIFLFLATILTTVCFEHFLALPPALGMTTGLSYLMLFGYYLKDVSGKPDFSTGNITQQGGFDIFRKIQQAEWDTLLFFYGILLSVQGMATLGYLSLLSHHIYEQMPSLMPGLFDTQTQANAIVGVLSAIIDNIPVMYAVLTMLPQMPQGQWLLVTLTAGVGGSLFSIGSAAGVALMGQAEGMYTFLRHLKWSWAIALGYVASIAVHLWVNNTYFSTFPPV